ncbi:hypothetical protein GUITHDRAFT_88112 [Guillardia theta CCMP2712]|uniref:Cleavage and polyadenylation specificity factor subunit 5 n=1 Tax=Guillardia theta (strain CCMP2712) TaxID=905079 RepID=L1J2G3_GUITC|nr:hypothetical protein GUITHDRAFT_88112 [Guillardia theta CCMP2712]EKX42304.1 hypothetical protein GUITHDRAFT_88112 [Guillardia theta CCMP2712]|eukprot:XP_005829284.1 hypothetical protein GUITHDRAFT_88112 [Guillardia theta CCMP2712]
MAGGERLKTILNAYPLEQYKIGTKEDKDEEKDPSSRFVRMEAKYEQEGLRRTVEGVLIVHQHKHPHVLLLQVGAHQIFRLPGGRLRPGETEEDGLKRKLINKLAPPDFKEEEPLPWEVGEELATWWRPNFDSRQYPYLPVHVTRPKECRKLFLIHLPETCTFAVAKNHTLVAIPFYELYDNQDRYGPVISSIPILLAGKSVLPL